MAHLPAAAYCSMKRRADRSRPLTRSTVATAGSMRAPEACFCRPWGIELSREVFGSESKTVQNPDGYIVTTLVTTPASRLQFSTVALLAQKVILQRANRWIIENRRGCESCRELPVHHCDERHARQAVHPCVHKLRVQLNLISTFWQGWLGIKRCILQGV